MDVDYKAAYKKVEDELAITISKAISMGLVDDIIIAFAQSLMALLSARGVKRGYEAVSPLDVVGLWFNNLIELDEFDDQP